MFKEFTLICFILLTSSVLGFSQNSETLLVSVQDQNGDVINAGIVTVADENQIIKKIELSKSKKISKFNLLLGKYILKIESPGFKPFQENIEIKRGNNVVNAQLELETLEIKVDVDKNERQKRLDEVFNGYLSKEEIANLPESGEEIKEELKRRYGDDILIRIDGDFDGSQIPSREEISSIKVVRNIFDAEFHQIASLIIDIRTKVATTSFNGFVSFTFNDSKLNARNAFDAERLPERKNQFLVFITGPIVKKKTSFSISTFGILKSDTRNFIGRLPDSNEQFQNDLDNRISFTTFQIKHNLPKEHLLGFRYRVSDLSFSTIGAFDLPERGSISSNPRHDFSITESGTINGKYLNDFRIKFGKEYRKFVPNSLDRTIIVLDAFNQGGSGLDSRAVKTKFGLADNLALDVNKHSLKLGVEFDYEKLSSVSRNNLNGRFIFSSLEKFENQTPAQYSQTLSPTEVGISQIRASLYLQDYFKLDKSIQVSLGLRYETQNDLDDRNNFSPRLGYVWSPEKSGKFIIRGGFGVFFDWLTTETISPILSNDGRQGQNLIITNPGFPNPFEGGTVSQILPISISKLDENLTNPYILIFQNSFNYKVGKPITIEGIYTFRRGLNQFRSRDTNAPINGKRPNPLFGRVQLLESSGVTREHLFDVRINSYYKGINIYANYQLAERTSDFEDALSLPTDSNNLAFDRGFSNLDQRHKLNLSFNFDIWNIKVSPSIRLESGLPYTVTTGTDDNDNTVFNDRPFGFERNSERGEWQKQANLRFQFKLPLKFIGFGNDKSKKINLNTNVRNIFNTTNFTKYVGVQTSPFFKKATLAKDARSFDLGISYVF